jgi:hypothetical protein
VSSVGAGPSGSGRPSGNGSPRSGNQAGIAAAITEVTERASVLIREEIELAKTEITAKTTRLAKGAVVAVVAGVFFLTALFFVLIGCAWLLYYELPIGNEFTYFWGFFAMAVILVVLGALAGLLAAKAVKAGAPPTPDMAIDEARKIRETVSASVEASAKPAPGTPGSVVSSASSAGGSSTSASSSPLSGQSSSAAPGKTSDIDLGRGTVDGTTHGS